MESTASHVAIPRPRDEAVDSGENASIHATSNRTIP